MNRFKIGFAAIIALIAMSFTLVSKTSNIKIASVSDGCYQSVKTHPSTALITYTAADATSFKGVYTLLTSNSAFQPAALKGVTIVDVAGLSVPIDEITNRPLCEEATPFCCYRVIDNKVVAIFYGNPQEQ